MVLKHNNLSLAVLVLLGVGVTHGVRAQTIVQTFTVPTGTTVPFTDNFTFNLFNSNLGTLNSVTLNLNASIVANVNIINIFGSPVTYVSTTASVPASFSGPGGTSVSATVVAGPFAGTATGTITTLTGEPASASALTTVPLGSISHYEGVGGGTGSLTGTMLSGTYSGGTTTPGAVGQVFFGGSATGGETLTLTYNYSQPSGAVPEPGTATFLAAGVLGSLGIALRRRKKS